jgi:hypothetical protein
MVNVPISWQLALPQSLWILGIPWMKMVLHFTVSHFEPDVALYGGPMDQAQLHLKTSNGQGTVAPDNFNFGQKCTYVEEQIIN